jgi:hypothetical protein
MRKLPSSTDFAGCITHQQSRRRAECLRHRRLRGVVKNTRLAGCVVNGSIIRATQAHEKEAKLEEVSTVLAISRSCLVLSILEWQNSSASTSSCLIRYLLRYYEMSVTITTARLDIIWVWATLAPAWHYRFHTILVQFYNHP